MKIAPYQDIDDIFWLDCPGFDDDEQLQLAVWFEKIFLVNGKNIPYGLAYKSDRDISTVMEPSLDQRITVD